VEQLVAQIAQRLGVSNEQAMEAVTMVISYVKDKLPPPIAEQVDNVLAGQDLSQLGDQAQQVLGTLGGMFGKK
jgi:uncharacterized protein (DUF2267 family)